MSQTISNPASKIASKIASKTGSGNFFEDFRIGQVIKHATPRTITVGDVALYNGLFGPRFAVQSSDAFAQAIVNAQIPFTNRAPVVTAIATSEYPTPARRPANSVLDSSRFESAFGIEPRVEHSHGRLADLRAAGPRKLAALGLASLVMAARLLASNILVLGVEDAANEIKERFVPTP